MEADSGRHFDPFGTSFACSSGDVDWFINPNRFCRTGLVQAGAHRLSGPAISCYKFRTMFVNSDSAIHQGHLNQLMNSDAPMMKMDSHGDPRIIPFGRLLRASGLDVNCPANHQCSSRCEMSHGGTASVRALRIRKISDMATGTISIRLPGLIRSLAGERAKPDDFHPDDSTGHSVMRGTRLSGLI